MAFNITTIKGSQSSKVLISRLHILVSRHLSESHLQLLSDGFVLVLLGHQLVLQSVHLLLQLRHGLVGKLRPGLGLLQLGGQSLDLLLVSLLSGIGLLLGNLEGLQVVGHNPQLLLKLQDLGLSGVGSLLSLLQVRLAVCELLGNVLVGRSAASALSLASFSSFSRAEILLSSSPALFSNTFLARSESSAAVPALSSLVLAWVSFSSVFSRSSSRPDTLLLRAFISASAAIRDFSFSSNWRETMASFSVQRSSSVSSCLDLATSSATSSSALAALSLATVLASSAWSVRSQALSFSTFIACIFFLMASMTACCHLYLSRALIRLEECRL